MSKFPSNMVGVEKLAHVELFEDEKGEYFLRLEYLGENETEYYRMIFPKVALNLPRQGINAERRYFESDMFLMFGETEHRCFPDEKGNYFYREVVQFKTIDLTLEEIEKKLGHKVRIISEKEKKDMEEVGMKRELTLQERIEQLEKEKEELLRQIKKLQDSGFSREEAMQIFTIAGMYAVVPPFLRR